MDTDKDGTIDLRTETHTRGKARVFIRHERRLPSGEWSLSHSYLVSGEIVSIEDDLDGDGFFETLIVFDTLNKDFEVFHRQKNGSIIVGSTEVKASYRQMFQAVDEFWDNDIWRDAPRTADDKTFEQLMRETKDKIDSAAETIRNQQGPSVGANE